MGRAISFIAIFTLIYGHLASLAQAEPLDCTDYRGGPNGQTAISDIWVSTFHQRGDVNAPKRRHSLRWPKMGIYFPPVLQDGEFSVENRMLFSIDIHSGRPRYDRGLNDNTLMISVDGVDHYPIYSKMGTVGGLRTRNLLYQEDGTTYHSSEGYEFTGRALPGGWQGLQYENSRRPDNNVFARWNTEGEVAAVLACSKPDKAPNPQCDLRIKEEPLFAQVDFDADFLGDLALIERRAREFTRCLLQLEDIL